MDIDTHPQINRPDVVAEVAAAFARYEDALVHNKVEDLYGAREIQAFRAGRSSQGLMRELLRTVITTYGHDFATANCEFRREGGARTGRQSQTWLRTAQGWRVVAAHVSLLD